MKTRITLLILFVLGVSCGPAVAEDLNSLDVIVNLTRDFRNYHKKKQAQRQAQQKRERRIPHVIHAGK